ncbi:hypothetical protein ACJZ2D_002880 [Fusarium nematophilum]
MSCEAREDGNIDPAASQSLAAVYSHRVGSESASIQASTAIDPQRKDQEPPEASIKSRAACSFRAASFNSPPLSQITKPSKVGTRFSREALQILKQWLNANSHDPYPDDKTKEALRHLTGLDKTQLTNWLANARRRRTDPAESPYAPPRFNPSQTQSIEIPRRLGTPRPKQDMDPLTRWVDSPPEEEPADVSAIVRAVSSSPPRAPGDIHPNQASGSYIPALYPSSASSLDSSSRGSNSSAYSHTSGKSGRPSRNRQRRRKQVPRKSRSNKLRPFECTFCTETFHKKHDWQRHENSIHLALERWMCSQGPKIIHPESGKMCCVFCGRNEPDDGHVQSHNPSACQERSFNRKDHLKQHLRLVHNASFVEWSMKSWKVTMSEIQSRCGLYLISTERTSPFPFRGSGTPANSPRTAYELITVELMHFLENRYEDNGSIPSHDAIQLEACRIIFASEVLSAIDEPLDDPPTSWLRDVITSKNDISQQALFGPIRSPCENRLSSLTINGKRNLFDLCPLESELRNFVQARQAADQRIIQDTELQQEASRMVKAFEQSTPSQSYQFVMNWLVTTILESTQWLASFRVRMHLPFAALPESPAQPLNAGGELFEDRQQNGTLELAIGSDNIHHPGQFSRVGNEPATYSADEVSGDLPFWNQSSLYMLNDANWHGRLNRELRRWVASTMSPRNPQFHVPSDEELRHQARWIAYGDGDPWNQTHADNPEWLERFKETVGIPLE